jgi:hypothetical protein
VPKISATFVVLIQEPLLLFIDFLAYALLNQNLETVLPPISIAETLNYGKRYLQRISWEEFSCFKAKKGVPRPMPDTLVTKILSLGGSYTTFAERLQEVF